LFENLLANQDRDWVSLTFRCIGEMEDGAHRASSASSDLTCAVQESGDTEETL